LIAGPKFRFDSEPGMNHYPTTGIAMACFWTNEERPARVDGFDSGMDNLENKTP
jgi:hypothetical protein